MSAPVSKEEQKVSSPTEGSISAGGASLVALIENDYPMVVPPERRPMAPPTHGSFEDWAEELARRVR